MLIGWAEGKTKRNLLSFCTRCKEHVLRWIVLRADCGSFPKIDPQLPFFQLPNFERWSRGGVFA